MKKKLFIVLNVLALSICLSLQPKRVQATGVVEVGLAAFILLVVGAVAASSGVTFKGTGAAIQTGFNNYVEKLEERYTFTWNLIKGLYDYWDGESNVQVPAELRNRIITEAVYPISNATIDGKYYSAASLNFSPSTGQLNIGMSYMRPITSLVGVGPVKITSRKRVFEGVLCTIQTNCNDGAAMSTYYNSSKAFYANLNGTNGEFSLYLEYKLMTVAAYNILSDIATPPLTGTLSNLIYVAKLTATKPVLERGFDYLTSLSVPIIDYYAYTDAIDVSIDATYFPSDDGESDDLYIPGAAFGAGLPWLLDKTPDGIRSDSDAIRDGTYNPPSGGGTTAPTGWFDNVLGKIGSLPGQIANGVAGALGLSSLFNGLKSFLAGWWQDLMDLLNGIKDLIANLVGSLLAGIRSIIEWLSESIRTILLALFNPSISLTARFTDLRALLLAKFPIVNDLGAFKDSIFGMVQGSSSAPNWVITIPVGIGIPAGTYALMDWQFMNEYRTLIHSLIVFGSYALYILFRLPKQLRKVVE